MSHDEMQATGFDPDTGRYLFAQLDGIICPHCGKAQATGQSDEAVIEHGAGALCEEETGGCGGTSILRRTRDGWGLVTVLQWMIDHAGPPV